jgi:hypothetical protein
MARREHSFSPNCRPYGVCNEYEGSSMVVYKDGVNRIKEICTAVATSS